MMMTHDLLPLNDLLHDIGLESITEDRIGFPGSCLAESENRRIEPLEHTIEAISYRFEDFSLCRPLIKDLVVYRFHGYSSRDIRHFDQFLFLISEDYNLLTNL